jgi:hypothetical protein
MLRPGPRGGRADNEKGPKKLGADSYQDTAELRVPNPKHGHSTITNGTRLLPGKIDGRSAWVIRCTDLIELHTSDLGGETNCSAAERALVRRAAVLIVELERMEQKFALNGEASDKALDLYQRMAGSLRRLLETTGLRRRARDINPPQSLTEIASEYVNVDAD